MLKISPEQYFLGPHALIEACSMLPRKSYAFVIMEPRLKRKLNQFLQISLSRFKIKYGNFNGECTVEEVQRLVSLGRAAKCSYIIGLGGGKALDTSKSVSNILKKPIMTVPTSAATCACWTALSAFYNKRGEFVSYELFDNCPDILVSDTDLLLTQPPRLLASGMADALAKYYETRAFLKKTEPSPETMLVMDLCGRIYENIFCYGIDGYEMLRKNRRMKRSVLETIFHTNIMLPGLISGIGGEGCRAGVVHAVANGLTRLSNNHGFLHGELVAYGILVQLMLENDRKELKKIKGFFKKLGLPVSSKDMGLDIASSGMLKNVCNWTLSKKETMGNFWRPVSRKELCEVLTSV
jgi:glycerol dehydrogenase